MYEFQNNILSIPAKLLYEDWGLMSYKSYNVSCYRGKLIRTKEGRGAGNEAFVSFYDLPYDIKKVCIEKLGHPKDVVVRNLLEDYILPCSEAISFFANHRKPNGKPLSNDDQKEKATNAMILNAIQMVLKDYKKAFKKGISTQQRWENISEAVGTLNTDKWSFSLPGNWKRLKAKYESYVKTDTKYYYTKEKG